MTADFYRQKLYRAERAAFDREVELHKAHIALEGWLDVGQKGREVRFAVPVQLRPRTVRP